MEKRIKKEITKNKYLSHKIYIQKGKNNIIKNQIL